jgi:hypothetical protein
MKTTFLLMARYEGLAIIPVGNVCADYFPHLTPTRFVEKVRTGEIRLPLVRLEKSQKAAKGIALTDLAAYLDAQIESARRDLRALTRV